MLLPAAHARNIVEDKFMETPEDEATYRIGAEFGHSILTYISTLIQSAVEKKHYQIIIRFYEMLDAEVTIPEAKTREKAKRVAEHTVKKFLSDYGYHIVLYKDGQLFIEWR